MIQPRSKFVRKLLLESKKTRLKKSIIPMGHGFGNTEAARFLDGHGKNS